MEDYRFGHHTQVAVQYGGDGSYNVPADPRRMSLLISVTDGTARVYSGVDATGPLVTIVGSLLDITAAEQQIAEQFQLNPGNVGQLLYGPWLIAAAGDNIAVSMVDVIALPELDRLITGRRV